MKMHRLLPIALVLAALVAPASAETLYKLIDKKGKVTYVQEKPRDFDGQVIPMQIDSKVNSAAPTKPPAAKEQPASAPKPKAESLSEQLDKRRDRIAKAEARVEQARQRLEAAKKALAEASPGEGDLQVMQGTGSPTGGGGPANAPSTAIRPGSSSDKSNCRVVTTYGKSSTICPSAAPTPEFQERLKGLEDNVKKAEEELDAAQQAWREVR